MNDLLLEDIWVGRLLRVQFVGVGLTYVWKFRKSDYWSYGIEQYFNTNTKTHYVFLMQLKKITP